jgi:aerobic-type carbon monoxide dehydrogenase small subunit (CoxS/CutS family)
MPHDPLPGPGASPSGVSRRSFIKTVGVSAAATSISGGAEARAASVVGDQPEQGVPVLGPDPVEITLDINGKPTKLTVEPATTLLAALRERLNLTGSKEICDRGACGGCSVLVDGQLVNACMMLALDAVGTRITTVEGLAVDGRLDPVQESFVRHDGLQCGYCTPGLVMACRALLNDTPKPTLEQIKRGLSGNICRCGAYTNIFNAALEASGQPPITDQKGA